MSNKPSINLERLKSDLCDLHKIGYDPETHGVTRKGLSKEDYEGRLWFMEKCREIGLDPYMDGACNVIARYGDPDKPAVILGSHIDTVPDGGQFDGNLGVLAGLECIRVIKENNIELNHPIEVVAFSEEEGRFGGMFGVQSMCGFITPEWIETVHDADGIYLKDEMIALGLDPLEALNAYRDPKNIKAFLEIHIEQGPVLESTKTDIGIVEGITGVFDCTVRLIGEANHSGTTPMEERKDAFLGLCDFGHEFPNIIEQVGSDISRLTIGKAEILPGFTHIVPGKVEFSFSGRDLCPDILKNLADTSREKLSEIARNKGLMFEFEENSWLEPQACNSEIIDVIENSCQDLGLSYKKMPSGAGHDTQFMAKVAPAGLIFVPSVGGISHSPKEWTHWADVEKGANVLLSACLLLAQN